MITKFWKRTPAQVHQTHDLSRLHICYRPENKGQRLHAYGFHHEFDAVVGDFVVLRHPQGGTTRYRVTDYDYPLHQPSPPGQWFATLEFAPRETSDA